MSLERRRDFSLTPDSFIPCFTWERYFHLWLYRYR